MSRVTRESRASMFQRIVVIGSGGWAALILLISIGTFGQVNADARLLVGSAILVATGAAVAASWLAGRERFRWAAMALLVSVIAPTYFLWMVNILPLLLAAAALSATFWTQPRRSDTEG